MPDSRFKPWTADELAAWERNQGPRPAPHVPLTARYVVLEGHGTVKGYIDGCRCLECSTAALPFLEGFGLDSLDAPA